VSFKLKRNMTKMDNHRSLIETRRIRYAVNVLLAIGIPFTGFRSIIDFGSARYTSAVLLFSLCLTLVTFFVALRTINRPQAEDRIYRFFFFVFMILLGAELIYLVGIAGELNKLPWFYIFPIVVFNIYGYKHGATLTTFLLIAIIITWFIFPLSLDTMQETLRNRFAQSVVLLTIIFFFAERQRYHQQEDLILKQQTLTKSEKNLNDTNILLKAENGRRKVVEEELIKYKEQLELLVRDRTEQLEMTNQHLVQEIEEREQTEKKRLRLEEQLRQSQKMEAIGVLAGGIAHDFNNILGTMMGYSELLIGALTDESDEKEYANTVYQAGERAADLVSQILTFSRVEEPELKPLSFTPFLIDVINMVRATLPATIEIRQNIKVHQPTTILANRTQIHQVIMNLCNNAAYAMRNDRGVLDVELAEVQDPNKRYQPPHFVADSYLELIIKDSGSGIPSEIKERIFDPFFTTKNADEGTGLGLSIVHGIVESHHGKILIDSEENSGTSVYLLFPVIGLDEPVEEIPSFVDSRIGQRILIAEDELSLAKLYKISLTEAGYKVTLVGNGKEAIEIFRSNPDNFDLLFTDQIMPKMTGVELGEEVLKIRPDLPIIMATGHDISASTADAKSVDISHYLKKPVKMAELKQLIEKILVKQSTQNLPD
jgi:signal transduction histidine kinase/ActR/RegA family two-component response regulator